MRYSQSRRLALAALLLASTAPAALAQSADQPVNAGEVSANAGLTGGVTGTKTPTQKQVFDTGETIRVLTPAEVQGLGPSAGGAQSFGLTPGAYVNGYGDTGATKYTIALDGIGQGWGGYGGYSGGASLMLTLDGVPIVDPITGLWASASIPDFQLFQSQATTYGPGSAADRWYDNIGGSVEFTPNQPTVKPGGFLNLSYGSYGDENLAFGLNSGEYDGWSGTVEGSFGQSNSYRVGPDGFNNPSNDYALYGKVVKRFSHGDISFGGYGARSAGYRPQVIPTAGNPYITVNGQTPSGAPIPGTQYSQKTCGFYCTPAYANYEKFDVNQLWTIYTKLNLYISDTLSFHNMAYYVREDRLHSRLYDSFPADAANQYEFNNPHSYWYGDRGWFEKKLGGMNTLSFGGYAQQAEYTTQNAFYNVNAPYFGSRSAPNAKYRSGVFNQFDGAVFLQDDFHPWPNLHIVPGIRYVAFDTNYFDNAANYFPNATGHDQGAGPFGAAGRSFSEPEPSVEINYQPLTWLALYASYEQAYKTPQVGGGGGLYQAIAPSYAGLALSSEYQIGFKALFNDPALYLNKFDFGANYFYLRYADQTINTALANGTSITSFGTSDYQGANIYVDDNPVPPLHLFANASLVNAVYS
ncbi:MAG: TonB-dependent receptor, partial [Acidocella sp.]|nr:TonB-dependent receptor [Acidocella sp.]